RISGGTSTGANYLDNCAALVDATNATSVIIRPNGDKNCNISRPFQTNVRGTLSYTIPWVDVLFSSTFSYRPGVALTANYTYNLNQIEWMPGSDYRYSNQAGCPTTGASSQGCLTTAALNTATTFTTNLLAPDAYGEGIRLFDIKLAKNIRFNRRRVN